MDGADKNMRASHYSHYTSTVCLSVCYVKKTSAKRLGSEGGGALAQFVLLKVCESQDTRTHYSGSLNDDYQPGPSHLSD